LNIFVCCNQSQTGGVVVGASDEFGFLRVSLHKDQDHPQFLTQSSKETYSNDVEMGHGAAAGLKRPRMDEDRAAVAPVLELDAVMPNQRMEREASWTGLDFAAKSSWESGRAAVTHLMARETIVHEWNHGSSGRLVLNIIIRWLLHWSCSIAFVQADDRHAGKTFKHKFTIVRASTNSPTHTHTHTL
jgi:hypothetical protein